MNCIFWCFILTEQSFTSFTQSSCARQRAQNFSSSAKIRMKMRNRWRFGFSELTDRSVRHTKTKILKRHFLGFTDAIWRSAGSMLSMGKLHSCSHHFVITLKKSTLGSFFFQTLISSPFVISIIGVLPFLAGLVNHLIGLT